MFFQSSRIHPLFLFSKSLRFGSRAFNNRPLPSKSLAQEINDITFKLKNLKFIQDSSSQKYLDDDALKDIPRKKGIFHLQNVNHVKNLIDFARSKSATVRVMGAGHSVQEAIYAQNDNHIHVTLGGELIKVHSIDSNTGYVNVGAGCKLGIDPSDENSSEQTSFNYQVNEKGLALPILGGMSHQTIAGFLQTSTAGGSLSHTIGDVLEEIEFVNGKGDVVTLNRNEEEDKFNASVVSMGLFGIITRASFKLPKKYLVEGEESNKEFEKSSLVSQNGHYEKLLNALRNKEYFHMNWFPQKGVKRTIEWYGKQVSQGEVLEYNHPIKDLGTSIMLTIVLGGINNLMKIYEYDETAQKIIADYLNQFIPVLYEKPSSFRDHWYKALPNDDQADVDGLLKTTFTEIWVPLDKIDVTMQKLEKLFDKHPSYAGNFAIELYGAKKSPYWMSPSFGRDVFRVDPYWWTYNVGDPREYFENYWNLLLPIDGARLHWGKHMPEPGKKYGKYTFGIDFLHSRYPKLTKWLEIRNEMDPDQIFVTDYWRKLFNIKPLNE
ncbi:FAD-binding domain-containing protein [Rhizophagus irregularis]|uniref:D-arabinono-1,4-lactone oxidase n=3 Tax=Rhizophagus irregularis TaxID=588596 RepID=A0A2I1EIA6_9GLOM|nr:hypothetical protein GLOIN_2v1694159 [Rhizophagus irregularis DAOM 181602=DAOM 197198]EXX66539.1 D-arabinono-1,4-lactone oxidase [Rhizophagus irregularis DAOM 197198w]PKB97971.1 FAD-binding domain-containing protein [Rhizophagus irregularis]PKC55673.1 FAD-binding domain-containing protein [Rhizophagus irregularis]PKY21860.1 FAD-binding domain-containing protein [Rhizophagus irregularis]POG62680.1 hypothetical protein GLOIN_2v1694159 [Rhizophagus irregularis DAOM 181602=DAOM 197198]|eukprot:XP_025169546.1 hypothetical protein GLOIN_2v1694159 [Rhizophagus irregularis DAOM 181602=DAOM 197198]